MPYSTGIDRISPTIRAVLATLRVARGANPSAHPIACRPSRTPDRRAHSRDSQEFRPGRAVAARPRGGIGRGRAPFACPMTHLPSVARRPTAGAQGRADLGGHFACPPVVRRRRPAQWEFPAPPGALGARSAVRCQAGASPRAPPLPRPSRRAHSRDSREFQPGRVVAGRVRVAGREFRGQACPALPAAIGGCGPARWRPLGTSLKFVPPEATMPSAP